MSKSTRVISNKILKEAVKQSFIKLNPKLIIKNPIMFIVEIGFLITLVTSIFPNFITSKLDTSLSFTISLILFFTILFANSAESIAEGRGKAQADSLKKSKKDIIVNKLLPNGNVEKIPSTS
ncbi:hypothetical protein CLPU_5c02090 [Gottschalkia purinilytica]|uniref:Potassium-transporting ATPase subunit B n=1 Tax=Gottschalkia purinilytica TaxID=1503 RepID=A0A0L0WBT2_GOTPU|nr:hypothetical protein [Gottschalkia purinilytica]KNF08902.1 hypothetical protein CLPU_5c02090 [Gottschalkia purinilytica]